MAATKLRTEVIVNLTVVVGAALVFSGILLLWLTERELLAQQIRHQRQSVAVVSAALAAESDPTALSALTHRLLGNLRHDGWYLLDNNSDLLASDADPAVFPPDRAAVTQVRLTMQGSDRLDYQPGLFPGSDERSQFLLTVPIAGTTGIVATLQVRFTLADVVNATARARQFFVTFLFLYLVVLVSFGAWLLNRTVIRPVMELRQATTRIGEGNLDIPVPAVGPAEIGELAGSFNAMMTSLAESRAETGASIRSLREANAELQRTQSELLRSEKLASVGRLAAGMAHEIGNPLGAVVGYLDFLRSRQPAGSSTADILDRSQAELGRIDRLVRDLLDYAAPQEGETIPLCDPLAALCEARDLLLHQGIFERVELNDALPPALPPVRIPRHKLVQVLVNLLLNARDAVADGGTIRLAAGEENDWLRLSVSDNGSGIDAVDLGHIFDPFYTTKAPGKGRGLGLAVSHRIIEEAGGRIEVDSHAGSGSTFSLRLPRARGER